MLFATTGYALGRILLVFTAFFAVPLLFAVGYGEREAALAFFVGAILTAFAGGALLFTYHGIASAPSKKEVIALPFIGLLAASFFAGIPVTLSGAVSSVPDGAFEALSGLTTTGASILPDVESAARSILVWRATLQWVGGLATLAFALAIAPALNIGGASLLTVALPHGEAGSLTDRLRGVVALLLPVYAILTLTIMIVYFISGLPLFDAFCHALSTISSGGFSTRNESLGSFGVPMVETLSIPFMLLAATNFTYHWAFLRGRRRIHLKDPELRLFAVLLLLGALVIFTGDMAQSRGTSEGHEPLKSLRIALFSAASALSTTGFVGTAEQDLTLLGTLTLCALLFVGGGMGSTAAGMKTLRLLMLLRHALLELARLAHPSNANRLKYQHKMVTDNDIQGLWLFYVLFIAALAFGGVGFAATGRNLDSAFYLTLTAISNAGPMIQVLDHGFEGFSTMNGNEKMLYAVGMIMGRLEIVTILALFSPGLWRR